MFRRPRSWSLRAPGDLDCHSCTSCAVVWGAAKSPPNAFSPFLWDWRREHVTDCLRLCGLQMVFILPRRTYAGVERASCLAVSYTHLRAHETKANLVCRL